MNGKLALVSATPAPYAASTSELTQALTARANPNRDIRVGLIIAAIFFVGLLGWAAVARLDAAAIAPGKLVVSGQRQTVQHRDGGVVAEVLVKEGQHVRQGDVLVRLAAADVEAQERALAGQSISLLAQRARLQAEQAGHAAIVPPREFATLQGPYRLDADRALQLQLNQMRTRMAVLSAQRGVLDQRTSQASSSGQGYSRQLASVEEQLRLIEDELASLKTVAEKGFVSRNRIRALERTKADLEGQRGQYAATVAQSGSQAGESRLQILEARNNYYERIATELREVETSLADILPRWDAARDQLARTQIRAPATGAVVGLTIFTRGGVIAAGQKLMDIVPDRAELKVEGRISPTNADDVRPGQRAFVRFDTLHEKSLPALEGVVTRFSADAMTDERTGETYYTAEISIPAEELRQVEELRGAHTLRAGIPVGIQIPTRKRTALEYVLEPLTGAMRRSLHEQ
ncbi:HlyD family type I secretion periplasmic adaptor subunit [Sphingomonas sp. NSE70-1]|uniref:Membrane fusion protein (MFP) family protein n=1 Tax=Sphingomonas caseinilyticus TaxID=2908205 RepID=A0ABT0RYE0_9SPHN|nr:HlyD family type I secretion periplasmic adaptor subunit [Sphingomonas caseinilyticus]MCL6699818.1 HlyD family type I secretion periplasmic adaptor subunit [Sphingomonas caseinilyticus]